MTISSANSPERAGPEWNDAIAQASDWSLYLEDDPDDVDLRARFEQWFDASPLHRDAWIHFNRVDGLLTQTKGLAFLPDAEQPRSAAPARTTGQSRRLGFTAIAAAAVIAWIAVPQIMLHIQADHITGTAEERLVALEDGSTVRLAPGSAISVSYSQGERSLKLLSGEAYFEVTPDRARPFQVSANATRVTVLGTGFNVRLGAEGEDIAVRHGRVRVENPEGAPPSNEILIGGQWAHVGKGDAATRGTMVPTSVGTWSGNRLVAIDRPLSEVIEDARRYYKGAIVLTSSRLGKATVTGSYDLSNPTRAIGNMVQPYGGAVRQISPWLIIISEP